MYTVDRQKAAKILHVSVRTVDRYIQRGMLRKKILNGRIFVNGEDLKTLQIQKGFENEYVTSGSSDQISRSHQNISTDFIHQDHSDIITHPQSTSGHNDHVYKKLYEEVQEELRDKRKQLEGANYRVGQLEGQLNESIPLPEHKKLLAIQEATTETLKQKENHISQIETRLKEERTSRNIYMVLLIILLLLQPLWLLIPLI